MQQGRSAVRRRRRRRWRRELTSSSPGVLSLSLLLLLPCSASALRILVVPLLGNSPALDLMGVAAELRARGHDVLVVAAAPAVGFMQSAAARHAADASAAAAAGGGSGGSGGNAGGGGGGGGGIRYLPLELGVGAREEEGRTPKKAAAAAAAAGPSSSPASSPSASAGGEHHHHHHHKGKGGGGVRAGSKKPPPPPGSISPARFAVPTTALGAATVGAALLATIQDNLAAPCGAIAASAAAMHRLRAFAPDAVMALGLPVPDAAADSCGCLLAHALALEEGQGGQAGEVEGGAPPRLPPALIDVDYGTGFWVGPPTVPQFGTGLSPQQLRTPSGAALNLAAWAVARLAPALRELRHPGGSPWAQARARAGLPPVSGPCPLADALARLRLRLRRHHRDGAAAAAPPAAAAAAAALPPQRCRALATVSFGSWLLEAPRPLAAGRTLVGPGSPRPPRALQPPAVAEFVDGASAEHGLVLASFGTSFQFGRWLLPRDLEALAGAFADLAPTRVLWVFDARGAPPGADVSAMLGENTMLARWADYNDVLGHRNARALVAHGGAHGVYEAAFHGVPLVALPFMFEQREQADKLAARGAAVVSGQAPAFRPRRAAGNGEEDERACYTRGAVAALVREVLANASYARAARRLSAAMARGAARRGAYAIAADEVELALLSRRAAAAQ